MRRTASLFLCLAAASSASAQGTMPLADYMKLSNAHRVPEITARRFTHELYWRAMAPALRSPDFRVEEVGRSLQGREIRTVTYGSGPTRVLLWSQMHGDEPTASMALADIFAFLASDRADPLAARLREKLTIVFIPMLNPDGAELYQRHNAVGIDVNRDARRLSTPEARTLKAVRDRFAPEFGFNLHDQGARTRVGRAGGQAAIALLAPAADQQRSWGEVRSRARLIAAGMAKAMEDHRPGITAKYDDTFNPRAFGDLMQSWGTSTILIEAGALAGDPEKQELRGVNAGLILLSLDAIATGSYRDFDPAHYENLLFNAGGATDVILVGGTLVLPGQAPVVADISINYEDAVARTGGRVVEVGDLEGGIALDTIDVRGRFIHPAAEALTRSDGKAWLPIGSRAVFTIRASADPASMVIRSVP